MRHSKKLLEQEITVINNNLASVGLPNIELSCQARNGYMAIDTRNKTTGNPIGNSKCGDIREARGFAYEIAFNLLFEMLLRKQYELEKQQQQESTE